MYGIFFFVTAVAYTQSWDFYMVDVNVFFVRELNNAYFTRHILKQFLSDTTVCFNYFFSMVIF